MNSAHLHLALNHLPVVGVLVGGLLLGWGLLRREDAVIRAALGTLALAGLAAVGVYFTGEPAEELVERLAGVSEAALEAHEEAALWAVVGSGALAVLAAVTLAVGRLRRGARGLHRSARGLAVATLAAAALVTGGLAWTANLGGQIRHEEIRAGSAATATDRGEAEEEHGEDGEEDAGDRISLRPPPAAPATGTRAPRGSAPAPSR